MKKKTFYLNLRLVAASLLLMIASYAGAANWLFKNGKSQYRIVVSAQASTSEQTAARELQQYIEEISGVRLPLTSDGKARGRRILIGFSPAVATLTGVQAPAANDESFTYRTLGRDLLIYGGSQRGTMYGVFTFLEKELG